MSIDLLQKKINYTFHDRNLLDLAFTHRSANSNSYERLEFLGDNILGMIISEYLYQKYPDIKEGKLSRMRAHLVCSESLLRISCKYQLYEHLIVRKIKGLCKEDLPDSLLADIVESLIGAIYLDSDYATVKKIVLDWFKESFSQLNPEDRFKDAKTVLQERLQAQRHSLPVYTIEDEEEIENVKIFHVQCAVESYGFVSKAKGANKKVAEQAAARQMLGKIHLTEKENIVPKWQ